MKKKKSNINIMYDFVIKGMNFFKDLEKYEKGMTQLQVLEVPLLASS